MSDMNLGCVRATAIAVANAFVAHVGFANFLSEISFRMEPYRIRSTPFGANVMECVLDGRADRGPYIQLACSVAIDTSRTPLPIEHVAVAWVGRDEGEDAKFHFYKAQITEHGISFTRLDKSPHEV